jgi:hypothetical protein
VSATIDPVAIVAVLSVLVLTPPIVALTPRRVETLTVPVEIRLALRLAVLTEAAFTRPVAWMVLVKMLPELTIDPELRVVNPPITPDTALVTVRLTPSILPAFTRSFPSIWTVDIAGSYAQSEIDERFSVVAIGTPLRSRVAPKPAPPVSRVLPSRVMLVVEMDEIVPFRAAKVAADKLDADKLTVEIVIALIVPTVRLEILARKKKQSSCV